MSGPEGRPSTALPLRDPAAEDAFVDAWRAGEDAVLVDLVGAAIDARRPRLAGRLAGLLASPPDDPAVQRALKAARLMLHDGLDAADVSWSALDEAWEAVRRARVQRAKDRQRRIAAGRDKERGTHGRLGPRRR